MHHTRHRKYKVSARPMFVTLSVREASVFLEPAQIPTEWNGPCWVHPREDSGPRRHHLPHERQFFRSDDLRVFVPFGRGAVHGKICVQGGGLRSRSWSREGQAKEPRLLYMGTRAGVGPSPGSKSWV